MGKYRSMRLFLTAIGVMSIIFSAQVVGAATDCMDLDPPLADKPYACFKTPGGFIFETAEFAAAKQDTPAPPCLATREIPCLDPFKSTSTNKINVCVKDFPHKMQATWNGQAVDANLWCYQVKAPAVVKGVTQNPLNQLSLEVALPYFFPQPLIKMDPSGQVFTYTPANGCWGDSTTGFLIGDPERCGVKHTQRINPGSGPQRFSHATIITDKNKNLGTGPVIMAPKVGNSLEPGLILGSSTSSTFAATGFPYSVCQTHNGIPYYFVKDDFGCTTSVYACNPQNPKCDNPGTEFIENPPVTDPPTYPGTNECFLLKPKALKMALKKSGTGESITPDSGLTLKDFGFVGGANGCREGIIRGQGSCVVIVGYQGGVPLTDVRYSYPDCPLPEAPINLTFIAGGDNQVTLSWTDNSTVEDLFKLYRGKNTSTSGICTGSFSVAPVATITSTSVGTRNTVYTYRWTNLLPSTKYCFAVTARLRDGGESSRSNSVCVACGAAPSGTCILGN